MTPSSIVPTDVVFKSVAKNNPELTENLILARYLHDKNFFIKARNVINNCVLGQKVICNDFTSPRRNALFYAITVYHDHTQQRYFGAPQPAMESMTSIVQYMLSQGWISELDVEPMLQDFMEMHTSVDMKYVSEFVPIIFTEWILDRKLKLYQALYYSGTVDAQTFHAYLTEEKKRIVDCSITVKSVFGFAEAIETPIVLPPLTALGLSCIDAVLDGGVGPAETSLLIAATGGGKTVACNQFTGQAALFNPGVYAVYISTEQDHTALALRMVAALCHIPFRLINRGIQWDKITQSQRQKYETVRDIVNRKIAFINWTERGTDSGAIFRNYIDQAEQFLQQRINLAVLDWIGGALGAHSARDPGQLRMIYQNTVNAVVDVTKDRAMSTIVAAQAATTLAHNNHRVGPECIAENKSLGVPMTNVIGISNLRVGATEFEEAMANNQAADTFKTRQTAFFSKTRMNPPQAVPIFRNFAYQRFEAEDPDR